VAPGAGSPDTPQRAYTVLRHFDFRLLWSAELISTTGSQIQRIAIAWQVYEMTGDALKLGVLGLMRFVPIVIFGLLGGVLADQRDRRKVLFATQIAMMSISLGLAALTATGNISLWAIYAATLLGGALTATAGPARQSLIPLLVPRSDIGGAMSMNTLSFQIATVGGPALAGVIIAQFGVSLAYLIDGVTFIGVIAAIALMRARPPAGGVTTRTIAAVAEGFGFLRRSPILLGVMTVDFVATFFGAVTMVMPIFADEILGSGPQTLGLLLAAPAVGSLAGGIVMSLLRMPDRPGYGVLWAVVGYGLATAAFGLSGSLALSLLFLALSGASDAVSMSLRVTLRNLVTPDDLRGRISAAHSMLAMGGPQLGDLRAGWSASLIGAGPAVAIGGALTVASCAVISRLVPGIGAFRVSESAPPE